jgi:hypothetical protein
MAYLKGFLSKTRKVPLNFFFAVLLMDWIKLFEET